MLYTALRDAGHARALVPQVKVASAGHANAQTLILKRGYLLELESAKRSKGYPCN